MLTLDERPYAFWIRVGTGGKWAQAEDSRERKLWLIRKMNKKNLKGRKNE